MLFERPMLSLVLASWLSWTDMAQLTKSAKKEFDALPEKLRERGRQTIKRLNDEPALGKKLQGKLSGKRSVRLGATHRIIYTDDGSVVLRIRRRKDVYR